MNLSVLEDQMSLAREAGMDKVAFDLEQKIQRARKLAIAYEHYRYVPQQAITEFQAKLKAATTRRPTYDEIAKAARESMFGSFGSIEMQMKYATDVYDQLMLEPLASYSGLPPTDVLLAIKAAKEKGCFDAFEVASVAPIATQVIFPDPIVFGRVDGCSDRFYIAEWGSDISIKNLLSSHDG